MIRQVKPPAVNGEKIGDMFPEAVVVGGQVLEGGKGNPVRLPAEECLVGLITERIVLGAGREERLCVVVVMRSDILSHNKYHPFSCVDLHEQ